MRCIHVNLRKVVLILFSLLINGVQHSQMADNHMQLTTKEHIMKNNSYVDQTPTTMELPKAEIELYCPSNKEKECSKLNVQCLRCELNYSCIYGEEITTKCNVFSSTIECKGDRSFMKTYMCRYCYQTEPWEHSCELRANCNSIATTRSPYTTNCTVNEEILCLGYRTFNKNVLCNWTKGYRWSTALILSVTLGGFGADRFYLGHWQEGIGKLFSFGGLGVWTLIDVILISLHYLGPADGSLYI